MFDDIFAEIDIEPVRVRSVSSGTIGTIGAVDAVGVVRSVGSVGEPIAPRAPDPVRERFYKMRSLATKPPYPRNTSELFYRQARFMEDFTDDYEGDAKFNMYFPNYQSMGYDYLRTYFTWRTKVRSGDIRQTSLSYIFLYIYELLSGIGVASPSDGLDKLMQVRDRFAKHYPPLENYLPKWLKDYHVFYELPQDFSTFVSTHDLQRYYFLTLLQSMQEPGQLQKWNSLSGYDVTKSRFFKDGNEELFSDCFDAVLDGINRFCEEKGACFEDMLVYSVSRRGPWRPFKNALFASRVRQNDREVHISKYERYYCKKNEWTANLPIYYSSQKDFIGYILKKTEACLRSESGYKYKLAAELKPGSKPFRELQRTAAKRTELDLVITRSVSEFYTNLNRIVVEVDHKSLARIREEALETQEQLIVDEQIPEKIQQEASASLSHMVSQQEFENAPHQAFEQDLFSTAADNIPLTLSYADGWKQLGEVLTDTEIKALDLIQNGGDIKAYAQEAGIMLEVLIDGINEKASDCIGDSLLELADKAYIFEVYEENIKDICKK